jgi:hypothetical protein
MSPAEIELAFTAAQGILNLINAGVAADPIIAAAQQSGQQIADLEHQKVLGDIQKKLDWSKAAWAARAAGLPIPLYPT